MIKSGTTLSVAAISLIGSAVALAVMGLMSLVPLTITTIAYGSILTAVSVAIIIAVLAAAGYGAHPQQQASDTPALTKADFSVTDPLTRTPNRRGITISIMDAMALGERYGNPLSIAKLDLDHLDKINEKFGKLTGDRILAGVAAVITDALRMPDKTGRYADDEFILVMPQTEIGDACKITDRVHSLISEQEFDTDGSTSSITTSAGVTEYKQGDDLESLLSRVQKGVDASRSAGRNRVTRV
ncbi:MAG: GGDEF domain-containing protein [Acidiferrobacterales bacterium]